MSRLFLLLFCASAWAAPAPAPRPAPAPALAATPIPGVDASALRAAPAPVAIARVTAGRRTYELACGAGRGCLLRTPGGGAEVAVRGELDAVSGDRLFRPATPPVGMPGIAVDTVVRLPRSDSFAWYYPEG